MQNVDEFSISKVISLGTEWSRANVGCKRLYTSSKAKALSFTKIEKQ